MPPKRGSVVESPECRAAGDSRQRKGPTEAVFPADAVHCCQSAYGCTNLELFCPLSRPGTRKEYYPLAYLPVGTDSDYASLGVFIRVAVPPCAQRPPPPAIGRAARCARAPRLVAHFHNAVLYEYQGTVYVLVQLTHKSYQPGHMRRQRLHRLHRATRCDPVCPVRPCISMQAQAKRRSRGSARYRLSRTRSRWRPGAMTNMAAHRCSASATRRTLPHGSNKRRRTSRESASTDGSAKRAAAWAVRGFCLTRGRRCDCRHNMKPGAHC